MEGAFIRSILRLLGVGGALNKVKRYFYNLFFPDSRLTRG